MVDVLSDKYEKVNWLSLTNPEELAAVLGNTIILNEGKTKVIYQHPENPELVIIKSKDNMSAGDGKRRDTIENKGILSNETNSIVFNYLNQQDIPTHFRKRLTPDAFLADNCDMIMLEVIYRFAATWSYLKRNDDATEWEIFEKPVYELCYKRDVIDLNNGEKVSDPFIVLDENNLPVIESWRLLLTHPKTGEWLNYDHNKILKSVLDKDESLTEEEVEKDIADIITNSRQIADITPTIFNSLKELYATGWLTVIDGKIEFGISNGKTVLADIIDADSLRVWINPPETQNNGKTYLQKWEALDKQGFREGESTDATLRKYQRLLHHLQEATNSLTEDSNKQE